MVENSFVIKLIENIKVLLEFSSIIFPILGTILLITIFMLFLSIFIGLIYKKIILKLEIKNITEVSSISKIKYGFNKPLISIIYESLITGFLFLEIFIIWIIKTFHNLNQVNIPENYSIKDILFFIKSIIKSFNNLEANISSIFLIGNPLELILIGFTTCFIINMLLYFRKMEIFKVSYQNKTKKQKAKINSKKHKMLLTKNEPA